VQLAVRALRPLLRRLRSQRGVTLPELMIAMMIGLMTGLAAYAVIDTSVKQTNAIAGRVNATQRGRLVMDTMTRQLRSQVCFSPVIPALIDASDDKVTFYADLSDGSRPLEKRELAYTAATKRITERVWAGVAGTPITHPTVTSNRVLLDDVVKRVLKPSGTILPTFRYYAYNTLVPPRPTVLLATPLSTTDLARVAKIDIGFNTLPPASKSTPSSSMTLQNEVYVRVANPNDPAPTPTCV
jgi:prepilin-type N-terminal cleavage/methylation domain-containing protein